MLSELSVKINEDQYQSLVVMQEDTQMGSAAILERLSMENDNSGRLVDVLESIEGIILDTYKFFVLSAKRTARQNKLDGLDALEDGRAAPAVDTEGDMAERKAKKEMKLITKFMDNIGDKLSTISHMLGFGIVAATIAKVTAGTAAIIGFFKNLPGHMTKLLGFLTKIGRLAFWIAGIFTFAEGSWDQWQKEEGKGLGERLARSAVAGVKNMVEKLFVGLMDLLWDGATLLMRHQFGADNVAQYMDRVDFSDSFNGLIDWILTIEDYVKLRLTDTIDSLAKGARKIWNFFSGNDDLGPVSEEEMTPDNMEQRVGFTRYADPETGQLREFSKTEILSGLELGQFKGGAKKSAESFKLRYTRQQSAEVATAIDNTTDAVAQGPTSGIGPMAAKRRIELMLVQYPEVMMEQNVTQAIQRFNRTVSESPISSDRALRAQVSMGEVQATQSRINQVTTLKNHIDQGLEARGATIVAPQINNSAQNTQINSMGAVLDNAVPQVWDRSAFLNSLLNKR